MSQAYVGQILIVGFNFAPKGWAFCNGQLLPLSQNTALFSLLGTNYGGDGKSTFGLPNLQGCVPIQSDAGIGGSGPSLSHYFLGQTGGESAVTLLSSEIPSHNHPASLPLIASTARGTLAAPATNATLGTTGRGVQPVYIAPAQAGSAVAMSPLVTSIAGSSFPHNNMMPTLTLNYIICLQGIFPQRP